jgi:hypothetical protein
VFERDNYSMYIERIRSLVISFGNRRNLPQLGDDPDFPVETAISEELLGYLNELSLFEDEELKDDEDKVIATYIKKYGPTKDFDPTKPIKIDNK